MKASQPNDNLPDLPESRLDDNDPLWQLLGKSPRPEPDAWFTARTLARCRHEGLGLEGRGLSFLGAWRWALGYGLSLCLAVCLVVTQIHPLSSAPSKQENVQDAFEIMASLDTSDSDNSSSTTSWQDSSL